MSIQLIPIEKLKVSPQNVRKSHDKSALDELKASILAHGLINPLLVTEGDNGFYEVIAGGRRLLAHQALEEEGKLPKGYKVKCDIAEGGNAAELSLVENVIREEMHPADEFEAFNRLATLEKTACRKDRAALRNQRKACAQNPALGPCAIRSL